MAYGRGPVSATCHPLHITGARTRVDGSDGGIVEAVLGEAVHLEVLHQHVARCRKLADDLMTIMTMMKMVKVMTSPRQNIPPCRRDRAGRTSWPLGCVMSHVMERLPRFAERK